MRSGKDQRVTDMPGCCQLFKWVHVVVEEEEDDDDPPEIPLHDKTITTERPTRTLLLE